MARVTHVKHARARFEMVDKRDDFGGLVQVPVMGRNGEQKKTKSGKLVFRTLSVQDRSKPLPNYKCGRCGTEILPGMPYKWIEPKNRGLMIRCEPCPTWQVWEYSSSLSARAAEIQHNAAEALSDNFESPDDLRSALEDVVSEIRSLAEEKEEAASNMEEGFGHSTYQSDELNEQAEQLNSWADDIENLDLPELPDGEVECEYHWHDDEDKAGLDICPECGGDTPQMVSSDEPSDEQMDEWRDEARAAAQDVIDNCPV